MTERNKILVTGASGLLGSCIVKDLLCKGLHVKAMYRKQERIGQFHKNVSYYTDWQADFSSQIEWVQGDVLDYPGLLDILNDVDLVIHSAAMISFHAPLKKKMYEVNISGTANVLNACLERGIKKLIHVSSVAALGKTENGLPVDEDTLWIPQKKHSAYSISKFHAEMEVWRGMNEGLDAVIVNPSIILGPGEWENSSAAFFPKIYKGLRFYTTGKTGFVDVRDVSKAIVLFTDTDTWVAGKNERYLLNAGNLVYEDFFRKVAAALKVKAPGIKAGRGMLQIAWRAAWLAGKLAGKEPQITKDSMANATNEVDFDGSKITKLFDFKYRNINDSIAEIGAMYLADLNKST